MSLSTFLYELKIFASEMLILLLRILYSYRHMIVERCLYLLVGAETLSDSFMSMFILLHQHMNLSVDL